MQDGLLPTRAAARRLSARVCKKSKDVVYLYSCFSGPGSGGEWGEFPKRSKGADCKSAAEASQVQILHPPRLSGSVVEHLLGKEEIVSPILT